MKTIQVIDGADNCTFPLFSVTDEEFAQIFIVPGQDIEFAEDLVARLGDAQIHQLLNPVWDRPILKTAAHGTLFYGFDEKRLHFPASKRECDWDPSGLNEAQRKLYKIAQK